MKKDNKIYHLDVNECTSTGTLLVSCGACIMVHHLESRCTMCLCNYKNKPSTINLYIMYDHLLKTIFLFINQTIIISMLIIGIINIF